ncbi:PQQ-binding-like beta-propeller repeat protein [Massilia sp. TN1-12]|uniref:outer membrane protein assembly factor BamB family protein n=1 Tax=Massilia paldalensis TaxID=3377675 RepID=UPI003850C2CD
MHFISRFAGSLVLGVVLAGCGGGGGGGGGDVTSGTGSQPSSPDGAWLTFNPNPVDVSGYEGDDIPIELVATSTRTFSAPFNIAVIDPNGIVTNAMRFTALDTMHYRATLATARLAAGTHQTSLEVRVCEDTPTVCSKPFPGSPWRVPVKITAKPATEAASRLALTPSAPVLQTFPGEAASVEIQGKANADLVRQNFRVGVVDPAGLVTATLANVTPSNFTVRLTNATTLAQGDYTANVEVRLCRDDPMSCRSPLAGSPWIVPVKVSVKPASNLTALTPLPGAGAWSTYQGNAGHTGYVAASIDVARFSRRWSVPAKVNGDWRYNSIAHDNGMVYVTRGAEGGGSEVAAISEASGAVLWRVPLGSPHRANSPAAGNGQVYVATTGQFDDAFFWILDQRTGALLSKTVLSTQWDAYLAPTVFGPDVYTESGLNGGMSKFSSASKAETWQTSMPQYDGWTPAVDASHAYAFMQGSLIAVDTATGRDKWSVADPYYLSSGSSVPVVLAGQHAYVIDHRTLMAFDTGKRTLAWTVNGTMYGPPVLGEGVIYVLNGYGTVLEARAPADGSLLWSSESLGSDIDTADVPRMIATRNLAFVSNSSRTLAIDLATHKVVWRYPFGGDLSISSNGVLYISSTKGTLVAINLQ